MSAAFHTLLDQHRADSVTAFPRRPTGAARMEHKRSATAARKRLKPIARWGRYLLAGALLLAVLVASGISAQLFATSDTPHGSSLEDADPTLYAHGDRLRPLVEETGGRRHGTSTVRAAGSSARWRGMDRAARRCATCWQTIWVPRRRRGTARATWWPNSSTGPTGRPGRRERRPQRCATAIRVIRGTSRKGCTRRRPGATTRRRAGS